MYDRAIEDWVDNNILMEVLEQLFQVNSNPLKEMLNTGFLCIVLAQGLY